MKTLPCERCVEAIKIALEFGSIDGGHHKMWTIDQIVRTLSADNYDALIENFCEGADGPETYEWDTGIAP